MSRKIEQPSFNEYPVNKADGRIEILGAFTYYKYLRQDGSDGRWGAILLLKSSFGSEPQVGIKLYKWRWRRPKKREGDKWVSDESKPRRWFVESSFTINKLAHWKDIKETCDKFAQWWMGTFKKGG